MTTPLVPAPSQVTMYHCDGCGSFKGFNLFRHMSAGKRCTGTIHPLTYARAIGIEEWGHRYITLSGKWSLVMRAQTREQAERDIADYYKAYGKMENAAAELVHRFTSESEWSAVA